MNWIQQHILIELTRHSRRRYSELRPDGVEGNLFSYHLDGLIREKLVEKVERQYQFTTKGLRHVATLSLTTGSTRRQPQVLTAVVCQNAQDEYLLTRWKREPNRGLVSFPHGMVHYGRTLEDMAALELAEKAGLIADLSYLGVANVCTYLDGEVDRHMLIQLFEAHHMRSGRQDEQRPEVSGCFWARLEAVEADEFVPGFYEMARLVSNTHGPIFAELTVGVE